MISSHSGLVLLNKPSGITSFRVLNILKKRLNSGKVGHTGTLDKFAEGLMLVLTGKMTKLAPFFSNMDKEYTGVFKFGEETDTLDPEGKIIYTSDIPELSIIKENINTFIGDIMQRPPDFSAVHINGQRAYKLAVSGHRPDLPERPVKVYNFRIIEWNQPFLRVRVKCSKGTYIRSLARDLGIACGSRAHVTSLSRTKVGSWDVKDSVSPDNFDPEQNIISGLQLFNFIPEIGIAIVNDTQAKKILNGIAVSLWINGGLEFDEGPTALFDSKENFLALVEKNGKKIKYRFVKERVG
ncbi:MAG: tRNA pseudouridine(55) synthase TruB [Spirochaetales bacterium]|nr:tRNA pseudouridine(55) synthase TruB [Spirochaetales bacterium]